MTTTIVPIEYLRPKTLSASSLSNWEDCQAKFKAANVDFVPEVGKKEPAKVGTSAHYALEHFVRMVYIDKTAQWDDIKLLLSLYYEGYKETFGNADKGSAEFKDGLALVKKWHKRTDLSGWEVLAVEEKKREPIGETGVRLTYIFDRVMRRVDETGRKILLVTDYKGLDRDTDIPTPTGWTTMAKLEEGDYVIGGDGEPCTVVHKSEIHYRDCYRISFDDGTSIVCDDEHRWAVRLGNSSYAHEVLTPLEMLARGLKGGSGRQNEIAVEHGPVLLPDADLPLDPYVFGAWIGDGSASDGRITKPCPPLFAEIERRGYKVGDIISDGMTRTVYGIRGTLTELGVLGNKHLPDLYLRASYKQRLDLLRGIMDTDGHWNTTRQRAVLNTTSRRYAEDVYELVVSLGWTANIFKTRGTGFGKKFDAWQLWFTPTGEEIFIARPPVDYRPKSVRPFRRVIKAIEKVDMVPTQCIEVDSADHCFLAGRQMVKTHNTERKNYTFEQLRRKLQVRIYGLAAAIEFKEWAPDEIWVELDMLRFDGPVGVEITREQNIETWEYLLDTTAMILATDTSNLMRTLGPGCNYCPVQASCPELMKHVDTGGVLGLGNDIDALVTFREMVAGKANGLDKLQAQLDAMIHNYAEQNNSVKFPAADWDVVVTAPTRRGLSDVSRAAAIIGPELMAMIGKLNIGDVDKLLEGEQLTEDQKAQLDRLIVRNPSKIGLKIEPKSKLAKEKVEMKDSNFAVGDLVMVDGRDGEFRVVKLSSEFVGVTSGSHVPGDGSSDVEFAAPKSQVTLLLRPIPLAGGANFDLARTPASGATVVFP